MNTKVELQVYSELAEYLTTLLWATSLVYNECLDTYFRSLYKENRTPNFTQLKARVQVMRGETPDLNHIAVGILYEAARTFNNDAREWSFKKGDRPERKYGGQFVNIVFRDNFSVRRFGGGLGFTFPGYHNLIKTTGIDLEPAEIKSVEIQVEHDMSGKLPVRRYYMILGTSDDEGEAII